MARSMIFCSLAAIAFAVGGLSSGADAQTAQARRRAQLRRQRRAAELRLPRAHLVRVHPSGAAALQHAAQVRRARTIRRSRATSPSPGPCRPDGLTYTFKLQPNVKFHDGSPIHLGGRQGDLRAARAIRRRACVSLREATYEDIAAIETPDPQTVVFKLQGRNASMLANFASPWDCIYSAAKLKAGPEIPGAQHHGHRARSRSSSTQAGSHWVGEQVRRLLREGQALSRRLSRDLHQRSRRW